MKIHRAPVLWKKEGELVTIMSKNGVYQLNRPASELWLGLDGKDLKKNKVFTDFFENLLESGLIEVLDDRSPSY